MATARRRCSITVAIGAGFDVSGAVVFAGETRIGVGQRVGSCGIAAVEGGIAAQSSAQNEIVGCGQRQCHFGGDEHHVHVEGPSSVQRVRKPFRRADARHRYRYRRHQRGEYGEDQAEYNGRPVRNADAFAALQHEQQANTHNRGHAHCSHAHCGHQSRYERPCCQVKGGDVETAEGTLRRQIFADGPQPEIARDQIAAIDGIVAAEAAPVRGDDGDDGQSETNDAETFGTGGNFEIASIHLIIVALENWDVTEIT